MRDKCTSKISLNMSITLISMIHILPLMMSLKLLLKILLLVMDLNILYKTQITSKDTCNIDFRKTREIWFRSISPVLARHMPSSSPYVLLYYTSFDHNNLNLPYPALHTNQHNNHSRQFNANDVSEEN